jgi:outer membrane protein TolC
MNLLLGLPEKTMLVADSASLQLATGEKRVDELEQAALQSRKDLAALSFRKKSSALGIQSAKAGYYPSLAITGGYIAADIPHLLSITNAINLGIGVKYDLSSLWKTKTRIAAATAELAQVQANVDMLNDHIRLEINEAYENYLLSRKKITVYNKAIEQATENYRITKNKYNNTLATTTELIDADLAELQSKLNYTAAVIDSVVAYYKLLQTAGILNIQ